MLIYLFSIIIIFILIIEKKRNELLIFLSIITAKAFTPFMTICGKIFLGTYSLILVLIVIRYFFFDKTSNLYKIESLIISFITFLAIFIGEMLLPYNFKIFFIDKYIFYGLIISLMIFFLNKPNIHGFIGSICGVLLFEYTNSYFEFKKSNSMLILAGQNLFSIIISISVCVTIISYIQNYKKKEKNDSFDYTKNNDEKDLLNLLLNDKKVK